VLQRSGGLLFKANSVKSSQDPISVKLGTVMYTHHPNCMTRVRGRLWSGAAQA
jgi:hypothetical protein